jgi:hypothetical protein
LQARSDPSLAGAEPRATEPRKHVAVNMAAEFVKEAPEVEVVVEIESSSNRKVRLRRAAFGREKSQPL